VQCVIAEMFAFIFSRNSPLLGLVAITITDQAFYKLANDGVEISINLEANEVEVAGSNIGFAFRAMERRFMELGGTTQSFHTHGEKLSQAMVQPSCAKAFRKISKKDAMLGDNSQSQLAW
jgi:3-isopropylmalate dehydratase small subunit